MDFILKRYKSKLKILNTMTESRITPRLDTQCPKLAKGVSGATSKYY